MPITAPIATMIDHTEATTAHTEAVVAHVVPATDPIAVVTAYMHPFEPAC